MEDDELVFFAAVSNLPQRSDIATVERKLGVTLSDEHRALMETFGCFALFVKPEVWPEPKAGEVRPYWQFLRGIEAFGVAPDCPDELHVVERAKVWRPEGRVQLVPACRHIGGGTVVGYGGDHVLVEWEAGSPPRSLGKDSLVELLDEWISELLINKEKLKAERRARSSTGKSEKRGGAR